MYVPFTAFGRIMFCTNVLEQIIPTQSSPISIIGLSPTTKSLDHGNKSNDTENLLVLLPIKGVDPGDLAFLRART